MFRGFFVSACLLTVSAAFGQLSLGTTNFSDGSNVTWDSRTIDLNLANTGPWDSTPTTPGNGVYDPEKWAVVFKFNGSLTVSGGLTFLNHRANAPVVILVNGTFVLGGGATMSLNGQSFGEVATGLRPRSGPGGFAGGSGETASGARSAGAGPGGGFLGVTIGDLGGSGSFGSQLGALSGPRYGNAELLPLVGGSGGAASGSWNGGAGGGAILIVAQSINMQANSRILANGGAGNGGSGGGAGGGIRLVCDTLTTHPTSAILAEGGSGGNTGGNGRVRIEFNSGIFNGSANPLPTVADAGTIAKIWPPSGQPSLTILQAGVAAPADPRGQFQPDVEVPAQQTQTIRVEARNIPTDGTWSVVARVTGRFGQAVEVPLTLEGGGMPVSSWTGTHTFSVGNHTVIARAFRNP